MEDGSQAHAGEPPQPKTPPGDDNVEDDQQSASNTPRAAHREPVTELANQLEEQNISIHSEQSEPESEGELNSFDWEQLQSRFNEDMEAQTEEEHKIQDDLMQLVNFYMRWQQVPQYQEQERCAKRLRTRIAYVDMREKELETQREHHQRVHEAFQSALKMLNP